MFCKCRIRSFIVGSEDRLILELLYGAARSVRGAYLGLQTLSLRQKSHHIVGGQRRELNELEAAVYHLSPLEYTVAAHINTEDEVSWERTMSSSV